MKYKSTILVASIALFTACSKEPELSNVDKTAEVAETAEHIMSLSKSLAVINPSYSESYYRSVLVAMVQVCAKKADTESCMRTEIERLKSR